LGRLPHLPESGPQIITLDGLEINFISRRITVGNKPLAIDVGGMPAVVEFARLAPGFVGLWQINVPIPDNAPTGQVPLSLETWGQRSNTVSISVK
jgi:uncharacterized protein (TIGR03437 family)